MYPQPIPKFIVDGCAVPVHLYSEARAAAVDTRQVQYIGVLYDAPERPRPADTFGAALAMFWPSPFFADLRQGNHLRYLMGCTHAELKTCRCAMILHIAPHAEEVPRAT